MIQRKRFDRWRILPVAAVCAALLWGCAFQEPPSQRQTGGPSAESTAAPTAAPTEAPHETQPAEGQQGENSSLLVLVNATHPIPDDWSVELVQLVGGMAIDQRAYPSLQKMMDDCRAAGFDPVICSSYRTETTQEYLYQRQVQIQKAENPDLTDEEAQEAAAIWVARPGTSEHQLGFAVDIVSNSYWVLDEHQEQMPTQKWLMENSWRYGFILRYPTDKSAITKIGYEPWHYRYVGLEAAKEIYESGLCLEEYLGILD